MTDSIPIYIIEERNIPSGTYCYEVTGIDNDTGHLKIWSCPYWRSSVNHHEQNNGYCLGFKMHDWIDGTLLWDQVKECGINDDEIEI